MSQGVPVVPGAGPELKGPRHLVERQPKLRHFSGKTVFLALSHHGQRGKRRPSCNASVTGTGYRRHANNWSLIALGSLALEDGVLCAIDQASRSGATLSSRPSGCSGGHRGARKEASEAEGTVADVMGKYSTMTDELLAPAMLAV